MAFLQGVGEQRIFWQSWTPDLPPRAVIIVVHGAGEHSDRYRYVATRFLADNYAVYALDHRGHGRSQGPRALIDRIDNAVADVDQLAGLARRAYPDVPIFMLGHSMGGTVALCYALRHQDDLAGLILSSPLAALESAPAPLRLVGRLLSAVAPALPLISINPALVSRDPAVVSAYVSDPLVHHGKLPARTVAELAGAIDEFPSRVVAITVPTLILYGTADRLCPPAGSVMLGRRIGAADKTLRAYEGLFHEILNEPERDEVLDEICGWLASHAPAVDRHAAGSITS
jgi:alpha-beta hydrolase superfamily lysophospholipase